MRIRAALLAGFGLTLMGAAPAMADAKIYPHHAKANYCPAGLQPITISGVICCGTPNQTMSYQQVMMTPKRHKAKRYVRRASSYNCPVGTKGCSDN